MCIRDRPFHEYTVSFLAYLIWDPVHMYNATTNGWTNFEHQITFDAVSYTHLDVYKRQAL